VCRSHDLLLARFVFFPPEAPLPWREVKDATHFAPAAVQPGGSFAQSEDCLYLNIWAPFGKGPYPVFAWVHGGGYITGRSSDPQFDGSRFAEQGVICVTVAYRLGSPGFLDLEPLLGSKYEGSANNGIRDVSRSRKIGHWDKWKGCSSTAM